MTGNEEKKIARNSATCKLCKDEIESKHRHDFVSCKCGEIFVDGGKDYLRRGATDWKNFIDTCLAEGEEEQEVKKSPKILLWDVETSLSVVSTFSLYPKFISHHNILKDWHIICGSWKYLGEDKIYSTVIAHDRPWNVGGKADDYTVVSQLRTALLEADIIVHHNGDKFDLKKLNTRLIYHRLDPLPNKLTTVDTLKEARKTFAFTSNRLDYLGEYLKVGRKVKTDNDLWTRILKGDMAAYAEMLTYNQADVELLENVYNVMRPYINHPNCAAIAANDSSNCCVDCESTNIRYGGYNLSKIGTKRRFQCLDCGKWGHDPKYVTKSLLRAA